MRARTNVAEIEADIVDALRTVRAQVGDKLVDGTPLDDAFAQLETFVAVSLRIMKKTNPSKVRDAARTEEIKARMDGRQVIECNSN